MTRDRESTCAWDCTLTFPHDGPCAAVGRVDVARLREELQAAHDFFRDWFGLGPNPHVGAMLDRMQKALHAEPSK